jgi:hypothetical protein
VASPKTAMFLSEFSCSVKKKTGLAGRDVPAMFRQFFSD